MACISDLPDSLLLEIFSYIGCESLCLGARMVCSRWHNISHDPELWRYVDIPEHYTDDRMILLLKQVHEGLEGIECSRCENVTLDGFTRMAEMVFPRLRHLAVPITSTFPDDLYAKISKACPVLEELENVNANFDDICHPLRCQQNFITLKVVHDKPITTYGRIRPVAPNLAQQKRMNWLADLKALSDACPDVDTYRCRRGLDYVDNERLEKISILFPKLMFLELNYCSLTDVGLERFFKHQTGNLKEIVLDKSGDITDKGLQILAQNCPNLCILKISHITNISDLGVAYILEKCRKLQELHLNNTIYTFDESSKEKKHFSDTILHHIGLACSRLIFFRMFYSDLISANGIGGLVHGCRHLQGIMLYDCPLVDNTSLSKLIDLPFLKAVVLTDCKGVTPKGLLYFILKAPSLFRLTFFTNQEEFYGDMSKLAEEVYDSIDETFRPNVLKKLTLKGVGGAYIQLLTVLCPLLHSLDLKESTTVGTLCLETVLRNCEGLRTLDVQFVPNLEISFLHAIVKHASSLRHLGLGCTVAQLSTEALVEVITHCPSLTSITMDTEGSSINEAMLMASAAEQHGGHCFLHVDPECREPKKDFAHRFIELHFTPKKFLGSVPC